MVQGRFQCNVLGIDVGYSQKLRTTGVCRTGTDGLRVAHMCAAKLAGALDFRGIFQVTAIDAPVLPPGPYGKRLVESIFSRGLFQKRCKPGFSHVWETGQKLRQCGGETADQFSERTSGGQGIFPRVRQDHNIVEAFPNAFLGVLLKSIVYEGMPELKRGKKFGWLLSKCRMGGKFKVLAEELQWQDATFWSELDQNQQHDEQAALVCAATAICVWKGRYVAVGEPHGGYFFLPPWHHWASWAKGTLDSNRREAAADVWIDGARYEPRQDLPDIHGE